MRWLPLLLLISACTSSRPAAPAAVRFEASLQAGDVVAGATQGVGGTLINGSSQPIIHYGRREIRSVRLLRESDRPIRRADAPGDTSAVIGPFWERAYHLAFASEPGTVRTLELEIHTVAPGERLMMQPVRFAWPRDPGRYVVSVCSGYALPDGRPSDGVEVCARPVRVTVAAQAAP